MATNRKLDTGRFLEAHPVFSLEEATAALAPRGGRGAMVERLKHHVAQGRVVRVAREIYAAVPPGVSAKQFEPDPFLVARAVRSDGIFAYHSAFELLGVAHSLWRHYTAFTKRRRSELVMAGARLQFLIHPRAMKGREKLATQQVEYQGYLLRATGPERTLVEGFRQLDRVGGLEEHVHCAAALPTLDLSQLTEVLETYATRYLWVATGWFLERFHARFHVPEDFLKELETHRPPSPRYLRRSQRGGTLVRRWNLIIPEALLQGEPDEG